MLITPGHSPTSDVSSPLLTKTPKTQNWNWKSLSHVRLFATPWTVHGILQARILEWVAFPFSRGSAQPRDWTQVSCIAGGFFPSWATREAQEYWCGQPIPSPGDFPTQELNWGLLHCRRILYQLSYQGSPPKTQLTAKQLSRAGAATSHAGTHPKDTLHPKTKKKPNEAVRRA